MGNVNVKKDKFSFMGSKDALILEHIIESPTHDEEDAFINFVRPDIDADLLKDMPVFPNLDLNWNMIRVLGVGDGSGKARNDADGFDEYRKAAELFSMLNVPFGIAFDCGEDGQVNLKIGIQNDAEGKICNSLMSASFGLVEIMPSVPPRDNEVKLYARCMPTKQDVSNLDKNEKNPVAAGWMDEIAAVIIGTDCSIQMLFSPVSGDTQWIEHKLESLYAAEMEVLEYMKRHPQVSASRAVTDASSENINKLLSLHKKSSNFSDNYTTTLNVSHEYAVRDQQMENWEQRLRFYIRLYEQALDCGWMVQMVASAPEERDADCIVVQSAVSSAMSSLGFAVHWNCERKKDRYENLSSGVFPAYMVSSILGFPKKPFPGLSMKHRAVLELNPLSAEEDHANDISIGNILWDGADTGRVLHIPRKEMNRHTIVFGMTGGGKSNTVCNMLSTLDDLHFLVIEPVKGEYHNLPGIHRFTMMAGNENELKLNPFWFPMGSSLQYHIDSLKLIVSSAFDLYAAMPNILEQCLYRVYINCGWNIITGKNIYMEELPESDLYPTFESLCREVEHYLDESAFEGETAGNYRGALLSRLQSFISGSKGLLLNTNEHIDFPAWEKQNVVVELDALADDADKAIVMGALLIQYFQYIKYCSHCRECDELNHLFVLEEAHHLFKASPASNTDGANASGQLVSMLNNLLAEIRAYGEGFVIVDQSPSSISTSVLKNTAVKIVHRVDYGEDIKLLQSALLLEDGDNVTASLAPGKALVRFGTMQLPVHVEIPYYPKQMSVNEAGNDEEKIREGMVDSVISNGNIISYLENATVKFLNVMLYCPAAAEITEAMHLYIWRLKQAIAHYSGLDHIKALDDKAYHKIMEKCTLKTIEGMFPGQYCLHRMIQMYVSRLIGIYSGEETKGLSDREWNMFVDYKDTRIYPRIAFYYQNHTDASIRMIVTILGAIPEVGILKELIDGLWTVSRDDEEAYHQKFLEGMRDQFSVDLPGEYRTYLERLVIRYCEEVSNY